MIQLWVRGERIRSEDTLGENNGQKQWDREETIRSEDTRRENNGQKQSGMGQ